ncbi:MAG: ATP-binding protein, partial [Acidimicrobiales bacterium]
MGADIPDDLAAAIARGGEMGGRFAELDWSLHPLGPPAGWPVATRAVVAVALASRFPTVLWLGEDLFLVYNDAYLPILGDKHPAALGRPGQEVWSDIWDVIGPMLVGVMESGAATWSDDLMLPVTGSGRPEERYFTFTYSPIIATTGQVGGVFCVVAETTERVIGERRLQTLSALGAALMDTHTTDEVVRATLEVCATRPSDLRFVAVYLDGSGQDDSPLKGVTPSALEAATTSAAYLSAWGPVGLHMPRVVGDLQSVLPRLRSDLGDGCPEEALVLPLADSTRMATVGAFVVGLNHLRPFDDAYQGFCRLVADQVSAALANATAHEAERRRADALAELDRAKTAFLANVSHEFRTPLTLMLGPIEDAIASSGADVYLAERLATVERNSRRLLRLVNSLLDFSRIDAGETTPRLAVVDVGDLTAQVASSFAELCCQAGIELVLDCGSVRGAVDPEMWETVVLNLMSNAFKFTSEGSIIVRVEAADAGGVTVTIADTGTGIEKDDLPRLFDRFYRSADAEGRSVEGTGIGLSLVRGLVELHGGTVEIGSELGTGTNVTIRLPVPPAGVPDGDDARALGFTNAANTFVAEASGWLSPVTAEHRSAERADGSRPLLLVVDDNADMRRHLERILSSRWRTHALADGRSALEWARDSHPDLVVTDVMMPALDGLGLAAAIRADPELASTPLIMLSARAGLEAAGEGLDAGADDYVVKPFSSADLVNRVAARLEVSARERSNLARAEQVAESTAAFAELGIEINAARTLDELVDAILVAPSASLGATAAAIAVLEPGGDAARVRFTGDIPPEVADRYH